MPSRTDEKMGDLPLLFLQNIEVVYSVVKTPPHCPPNIGNHTPECLLAHFGVHAIQLLHLVGVDKGVAPSPFVVMHEVELVHSVQGLGNEPLDVRV